MTKPRVNRKLLDRPLGRGLPQPMQEPSSVHSHWTKPPQKTNSLSHHHHSRRRSDALPDDHVRWDRDSTHCSNQSRQATNWSVTGIGAFQNDSILQSLFVHAHLRGKDFTYVLTYPDGREEILLRVPNYSFDWQFEYELVNPIRVPAGSTVKVIARYDNSRSNRLNPAPHKEAYWSEQSWDDMFLTNVKYIEANND
jgi:hypothetical protein